MDASTKDHNWKRMRFRRNKVWLAVDEKDRPLLQKGKVLIKYQLDQEHQYWVHSNAVRPLDDPIPEYVHDTDAEPARHRSGKTVACHLTSLPPEGSIRIYTGGACTGNPGPAGVGVVLQYRRHRKEMSRHIGTATKKTAELEAIRQGLQAVINKDLPVVLYTDSVYALGVLTKGRMAPQDNDLIHEIKLLSKQFNDLTYLKVQAHSGDPENERAGRLAVMAIQRHIDQPDG